MSKTREIAKDIYRRDRVLAEFRERREFQGDRGNRDLVVDREDRGVEDGIENLFGPCFCSASIYMFKSMKEG